MREQKCIFVYTHILIYTIFENNACQVSFVFTSLLTHGGGGNNFQESPLSELNVEALSRVFKRLAEWEGETSLVLDQTPAEACAEGLPLFLTQ